MIVSWKDKLKVYLWYTLGFIILMCSIIGIWEYFGVGYLLRSDITFQYLPSQSYITSFYERILDGVQMFNFNIGMGQDTLFTYSYLGLMDVVSILVSALTIAFTLNHEVSYILGIVIRMYLAGAMFSAMCIYFRRYNASTILGSLLYVFLYTVMMRSNIHPYYVNLMIWMPLVIISIDVCVNKCRYLFFVVVSFLTIVSNIYYSYAMAIFIAVFTLIDVIFNARKYGILESLKTILRIVIAYFISVLMAGGIIIPVIYSVYNSVKVNNFIVDYYQVSIVLSIFIISYIFVLAFKKICNIKNYKNVILNLMLFLCLIVGVSVSSYDMMINKEVMKKDEVKNYVENRGLETIRNEAKSTFIRVENSKNDFVNSSDIYLYPGVSVNYPVENKYFLKFNSVYKNADAQLVTKINGLNSRAILDDILSVKYYVGKNKSHVPFGFVKTPIEDVYVNQNYIPFGFTYSSYVLPYEVASLNTLDAQELLLKACLVDSNIEGVKHIESSQISEIRFKKTEIDFKVKEDKTEKNKQGNVNHVLNIECETGYDGELYLKIPNLNVNSDVITMKLELNGIEQSIDIDKRKPTYYIGSEDLIINLGYVKKGKHSVNISLPEKVKIQTSDISFECRYVDMIESEANDLAKEHMYDIKMTNNGFRGYISNKGTKLLFISIPYDESWRAYVDSEQTRIYKANEGFMAIKLEGGDHLIEFKYKRPFQFTGIIVSLIGIGILILLMASTKIGRDKRNNKFEIDSDEIFDEEELVEDEVSDFMKDELSDSENLFDEKYIDEDEIDENKSENKKILEDKSKDKDVSNNKNNADV